MQELYTSSDMQALHTQLKKRYLFLGIFALAIIVLLAFSLIIRWEWLTVTGAILLGSVSIFVLDLLCRPLRQREKLMDAAIHGRTHTADVEYARLEPDQSMVDGVLCNGLVFLGAPDKHGSREQLYYWDAEIPLPDFQEGMQVTIRYTAKNLIGYEIHS